MRKDVNTCDSWLGDCVFIAILCSTLTLSGIQATGLLSDERVYQKLLIRKYLYSQHIVHSITTSATIQNPSVSRAATTQGRTDNSRSKPILAFHNLAHVEVRWVCQCYEPVDTEILHPEDLRQVLDSLEVQLLAYPRAKTLIFDFVGWEHARLLPDGNIHGIRDCLVHCLRLLFVV